MVLHGILCNSRQGLRCLCEALKRLIWGIAADVIILPASSAMTPSLVQGLLEPLSLTIAFEGAHLVLDEHSWGPDSLVCPHYVTQCAGPKAGKIGQHSVAHICSHA